MASVVLCVTATPGLRACLSDAIGRLGLALQHVPPGEDVRRSIESGMYAAVVVEQLSDINRTLALIGWATTSANCCGKIFVVARRPSVRCAIATTKARGEYISGRSLAWSGATRSVVQALNPSGQTEGFENLVHDVAACSAVSPSWSAVQHRAVRRGWAVRLGTCLTDPSLSLAVFATATRCFRDLIDESVNYPDLTERLELTLDTFLARQLLSGKKHSIAPQLRADHSIAVVSTPPAVPADAAVCRELGFSGADVRRMSAIRGTIRGLLYSCDQVSQLAYRAGYDHPSGFNRDFLRTLGVSPLRFRQLFSKG